MPRKQESAGATMAQSLAMMVIQNPEEYDTFLEEWARISASFGGQSPKASKPRIVEVQADVPMMELPEGSRVLELTDGTEKSKRVTKRDKFRSAVVGYLRKRAGEWCDGPTIWREIGDESFNSERSKYVCELVAAGTIEKIGSTRNARYRVPSF